MVPCLFYARRKCPELAAQPLGSRLKSLPFLLATLPPLFLRLSQQLASLLLAQVLALRFPTAYLFGPVVLRVPGRHAGKVSKVKSRLLAPLVVLRPYSLPFPIQDRVLALHHRSQASQHLRKFCPRIQRDCYLVQ